ncbi:hypothetical protein ASF90_16720 [Xanthomonas sp. Leaf148]|nr:hypothetical protein ASF90_16720 [Xanthomonas sp. Leaf148]
MGTTGIGVLTAMSARYLPGSGSVDVWRIKLNAPPAMRPPAPQQQPAGANQVPSAKSPPHKAAHTPLSAHDPEISINRLKHA